MPEWSNGAVSKTVDRHPRSEGSNPSPSAKENFLGIKLLIINDKAVLFFYIYTKSTLNPVPNLRLTIFKIATDLRLKNIILTILLSVVYELN